MKKIIFVFLIISFADLLTAQWIQVSSTIYPVSFATSGNNIIASVTYGVYLSTNNGNNWTYIACNGTEFYSLAAVGNSVFAGAVYGGVFLSTNNGLNWPQTPQNSMSIKYLTINNTYLFAGAGLGGGFYRSSNNGINWSGMLPSFNIPYALAANGNNVISSCIDNVMYNAHVWRSSNNGDSWTDENAGLPDDIILSFCFSNTCVFAGCSYGVYRTTNNGVSWYQTALNNRTINCLVATGNNIFAGTNSGVYLSTNNGLSWTQKDEGFNGDPTVVSLLIANDYIFASSGSIWRRQLSELIVGIENTNLNIPDKFSLYQNYPNPFNPGTTIKFDIPSLSPIRRGAGGMISLKVYDILGKEIATLVNEKLQPGTYEVTFDAGSLPSGVYFYKLQTGDFVDTKKLMVIK